MVVFSKLARRRHKPELQPRDFGLTTVVRCLLRSNLALYAGYVQFYILYVLKSVVNTVYLRLALRIIRIGLVLGLELEILMSRAKEHLTASVSDHQIMMR